MNMQKNSYQKYLKTRHHLATYAEAELGWKGENDFRPIKSANL